MHRLTSLSQIAKASVKNSLNTVQRRGFASDILKAASSNDIKSLESLIKNGSDVNTADFDMRRALHVAASTGNADAVKFLLSKGADVNAEDRFGSTPLVDALLSKQDTIVPLLRSAGAKLGKERQGELIGMMCRAAAEGNLDVLKRFTTAGLDINSTDYDLRTPLHIACSEGQVAIVEFLVANGARVNSVDRFGNTPLMEASRSRCKSKKDVVTILMSQGASDEATAYDIRRDPLLSGSISTSLQFLSERIGAAYAECWLPSQDDAEFTLSDSMYYASRENSAKLSKFINASAEQSISNTQSNNFGKAFASKQPIVLDSLNEKNCGSRFGAAKESGLTSGLVLPLLHNNTVVGVINFYFDASSSASAISSEQISSFSRFADGIVCAGVAKKGIQFNEVEGLPKGQMAEVFDLIVNEEVFNANLVYHEVDWFYHLGLQKYYFTRYPAKEIANHIHSYIAAKKLAAATGRPEEVSLNIESKFVAGDNQSVLCMCPISHAQQVETEKALQQRIKNIPKTKAYTCEYFMSQNTIVPGGKMQLGLYVLETSDWANTSKVGTSDATISDVASTLFLRTKTQDIIERYQQVMSSAIVKLSPFAEVFPTYRDGTIPVMFAFLQSAGTTTPYMLQLTELLKHNGLTAHRKYIETFANNIIVFSLYLNPPTSEQKIDQLLKQFSLLHLVPENTLTSRFLNGEYAAEEYTYFTAATRFVYYFLNKRSEEFDVLASSLKNDPLNLGRLRLLQTRLKREAVSHDRIASTIINHPGIVRELFKDFHQRITVKRDPTAPYVFNTALQQRIKSESTSRLDEQVLSAFLNFNTYLLKTNFYKISKSALTFRLDPCFLADSEWPEVPYGIFFVMGSDFQGFHIRFRDVARGGIRVIRSNDKQAYAHNLETLFNENYNLAYTQNKKNKDIPEFGSKGTILLNLGNTNSILAFQKYSSGLLDLLTPSDEIVDNYGREEILFLGPDEGTADYMEWAARYAAKRGYKFWRAFTTGKPPALGGVPHDTFGMTTRGVHRYVVNCLAKLNIAEETVSKFQTGGPDGDLGSNEILLSKDRTLSIVDGSGVVYDPNGLDRTELFRLAKERSMIKGFDTSKLSKGGFRILVQDTNVTLPNGEFVPSGLSFRNEFHLHPLSSADLFVPCGGRPESVNLSNVSKLFDEKGKPRFKIICEGANLFLTQDARMVLEKAGVILYKDASANKGGVTSSSLEVLAALALNAEEFDQHMAVKDKNHPPQFYMDYVKQIQERIESDADLEFECIWREHLRTKTYRYLLTDAVSDKINTLNDFIQKSSLWTNEGLRREVLSQAIPKKLQELAGLDNILARVPSNYLQAIFGAYLASRYVYKYGLDANEMAFFEFMQSHLQNTKN